MFSKIINVRLKSFSFTVLIVLFLFLIYFADNADKAQADSLPSLDQISINAPGSAELNSNVGISVSAGGGWANNINGIYIEIDFGDGTPTDQGGCFPASGVPGGACTTGFSHTYHNSGVYTITAKACYLADHQGCVSSSKQITINPAVCGNGIREAGEGCDDGNTVSGDGCDSNCQIEVSVCGNGIVEPPAENCDDGNTVSGDGCSSFCRTESGPAPVSPRDDELNPLSYNTFGELFDSIVRVIFWIGTMVGPLLIILGGFMMLFAGADPSKIVLGKKIILYTTVIFAIIIIIRSLTYFFRGDLSFF